MSSSSFLVTAATAATTTATDPLTEPEAVESPWAMCGARYSLLVNVVGGLLLGYSIGFIPIILQFNQYLGDCGRYTGSSACRAMTDTGCEWAMLNTTASSSSGACEFPDWRDVNCTSFTAQSACRAHSSACYWRYHDGECSHLVGWDSNQQGMLAGIQLVGAMLSAPLAGPLTNRFGRRWSMGLCGICAVLSSIFFTAGWATQQNYVMLVVAELLIGMFGGWISVICPMYCGEMAAKELEFIIGVMFQIALTFGIWLASLMGLVLDMRNDTAGPGKHLQERLQYVILLQWLMSAAIVALAVVMPESTLWLAERQLTDKRAKESLSDEDNASRCVDADPMSSPGSPKPSVNIFRRRYLVHLLVGLALSAAMALTGINAIILYAPQLVSTVGMEPMIANFVIMLWNFLTCCVSLPLVRRFFPRQLYIVATAVATVSSLMTGFAVYPGVMEDRSVGQKVLGGLGILIYIAAFEFGIGPCYYVLSQDVFPEEVRSSGCSYIMWLGFLMNVGINWGFPVAVTGLSGGPSGDQNLGMGICFFAFGAIGFVSTLFMYFKMPKSNSEMRRELDAARSIDYGSLEGNT